MKHVESCANWKFKRTAAGLSLLCWALAWALPSTALAHKVNVFAWVEGDMIHTQSKFYGGKKVQNGAVQVLDDLGNLLLEGRTDDQGEFSFKTPVKTGMRIVVSAGMGHQGEWRLSPDDFSGSPAPESGGATLSSRNRPLAAEEGAAAPQRSGPGATPDEIGAAVEKALDKKLAPVLRAVSKLEERETSLRDILGGIGYIIGLVGVAAYVAGRRKKDHLTQ